MHKKYFFKSIGFSFGMTILINFGLSIVYSATLPTFAIVDDGLAQENPKFITSESSIQTITPPTFNFSSKSQVLMEQSTGKILYQNNESEHLLPASVTKIMTLLLIMEQLESGALKLEDTVTCSANASKMRRISNLV